ncbi:response regulator transcription factor [Arthrobacter sp. B1805]|uniref:response regulator n=1 Tax=Arthrobacter sp. B1805 TaxID=2058892 RepID=UPI000CE460F4|nr:response regulator transcription factor [Arthrobacter sp. B1805]
MTTVLIVDDQPIVRAGLTVVLDAEPDLSVIGQATDGQEAVHLASSLRPDVVCMDVRMPGMDGITATRQIVAEHGSAVRVLILTTFDIDEDIFAALEAGAAGFMLKGAQETAIAAAIHSVAAGGGTLDQRITQKVLAEFGRRRASPVPTPAALELLTLRELDVLDLITRGVSNAEIARSLFIEVTTVKYHVQSIFSKTGSRDRLHAALWGFRHHIGRVPE